MRGLPVALSVSLVIAACSSDGGDPADAGGDAATGGDASSGSDVAPPPPYDGSNGACLGASLLAALGKSKLMVGASMQDATAKLAPFDIRYTYLSGGVFDGNTPCASCASNCTAKGISCKNGGPGCGWWGCWQYDQDPPGEYARNFFSTANANGEIPMITYYELLHTSGVNEGAPEVTQAASDVSVMTRYFADWRFLLQQVGTAAVLLHIEPDFWGYAEQTGKEVVGIEPRGDADVAGNALGERVLAFVQTSAVEGEADLLHHLHDERSLLARREFAAERRGRPALLKGDGLADE